MVLALCGFEFFFFLLQTEFIETQINQRMGRTLISLQMCLLLHLSFGMKLVFVDEQRTLKAVLVC